MHPSLFDHQEGKRLKSLGMEKASSWPFDAPVARARAVAIMLAKRDGQTHADAVYEYLSERLPEVLKELQPNSWGSVFQSPQLKFSGRIRESSKVSRHSGVQRCWEYNPTVKN